MNESKCSVCGDPATCAVNIDSACAAQAFPGPSTNRFEPRCAKHGLFGGEMVMIRKDEYERLKALERP